LKFRSDQLVLFCQKLNLFKMPSFILTI
jgi:hypothetical protein